MINPNYTHTHDNYTVGKYSTDMDPDSGRRWEALLLTEWPIPIYVQPDILVDF